MVHHSHSRSAFTLSELLITFVILAVLIVVAIPPYQAAVSSSQQTAATVPLIDIAHIAQTFATSHNAALPSTTEMATAISAKVPYTGQSSTLASPAPSTSPSDVSYDAVDGVGTSSPSVGLAVQMSPNGCALAQITTGGVQSWTTTSSGFVCDGTAAVSGTGMPTTTIVTATTSPTTTVATLTAPLAPANVTATSGDGSASVVWSAPSDGGSTITSYVVQYSTNGGATWLTASGCSASTSCTVTGLTNGTTYLVQVAATNAVGTSPYSAPTSVTPVVAVNAPSAPTNVTATYVTGTTTATIRWTAPSDDGYGLSNASHIVAYTVTGSAGGTCDSLASSAPPTNCTISGLTPGQTYTFTVVARNTDALNSSPSAPSAPITVVTNPTAPLNVVATYVPGTTTITLSWTPPADDGYGSSAGANVTLYTATATGPGQSLGCTPSGSPASTVCVLSGVPVGASYAFTVTATNAAGLTSQASAPSNSTGTVATAPSVPLNPVVTYTPGAATATVSWSAPAADGLGNTDASGITAYAVVGSPGGLCSVTASSAPPTSCVVTGLQGGSTYTFTVAATNSLSLTSAVSAATNSITVTTPPSPPTGLVATYTAGTSSASLSWTVPSSDGQGGSTQFAKYTITASGTGGQSCVVSGSPAATSCSITGLVSGHSYTFTATATNYAGLTSLPSAASNSTGVVVSVPSAPQNPTASTALGTTSATISWTAPSNDGYGNTNASGITSYTVTGSPSGTCSSTSLGAPTTSCVVSGLTPGTAYTFTVTASNTYGAGPASSATLAVTPLVTPGAPTGVAATNGDLSQSSVSWTAPTSTGGSPVTGYVVQYSSDGGATWTVATSSASTSPYVVTGLTNGTPYVFEMAAANMVGAGAFSSPSAAVTPIGPPGAPTAVAGTSYAKAQSTVSWSAPSNTAGAPITAYVVRYSSDGGSTWATATSAAASSPYTVTGLTDGTSYLFEVAATNSAGTGSFSAPSTPATPATTPSPPLSVAATSYANAQSSVSWATPATNGGAAITAYTVQYSSDGGTTWTTATSAASPYVVTGLTNGTSYSSQVAATNPAGTGTYSSSVTATPATVPGAPSTPSATSNGNSTSTVTWTAPASNGGAAITAYVVQYSADGGATWTVASSSASSPYIVTGLTNGTAYIFEVAAINPAGTGPFSGASASAYPASAPGAPTGVTGTPGNTTVSVAWSAPASNGGASITAYTVQYSSNAGSTWTVATSSAASSPYLVTGLANGTAYLFEVAATNSAGTGSFSSPSSSVTPVSAPAAPSGLSATGPNGTAQATISWTAPNNEGSATTDYVIRYSYDQSTWTTIDTASKTASYLLTPSGGRANFYVQVAAVNAIGQSPYSASDYVQWVQTGSYAIYGYVCTTGDTLSGTTCTHTSSYAATNSPYYQCNSGDPLSGSTCTHTTTYGASYSSGYYYCNPGDSLSGTTCTTSSSYAATQSVSGYSCPGSGFFFGVYNPSYSTTDKGSAACYTTGPTLATLGSTSDTTNSTCRGYGNNEESIGTWYDYYCGVFTPTYTIEGVEYSTAIYSYSCPSGGTLSGSTCVTTSTYSAYYSAGYYYCNAGDSLSGTTCYSTSYYSATYVNPNYTCPSGGTLSGTTCTTTSTYAATYQQTGTGYYYGFRG